MKILKYIIFIFLLLNNITYSQLAIQWQKSLGGTLPDHAYSITSTNDKGCIVTGATVSNNGDVTLNHGVPDIWVVKLDSNGTLLWQRSLGGSYTDIANCVIEANDSCYVIAGVTESNDGDITANHGMTDFWVIKLNSSGDIMWQKTYGGTSSENATSIQQTIDGGFIVAGNTYSNDGDVAGHDSLSDIWIIKINSVGTLLWQRCLGGSNEDFCNSIKQTYDHGFIVAGSTRSNDGNVTGNHGFRDFWVVKLDSLGNISWQKTLGGSSFDEAYSILQTNDSGYLVAGSSNSIDGDVIGNNGGEDFLVVSLDQSGSIRWKRTYGGFDDEFAFSVIKTNNSQYYVSGSSTSVNLIGNSRDCDYWLINIDSIGNIINQFSYGGSSAEIAYSASESKDGNLFLAGSSASNDGDLTTNQGSYDYWILKLSTLVGIDNIYNSISELKIWPNPFSAKTNIEFSNTSINNKTTIYILNFNGIVVKIFKPESCKVGINKILWDETNNYGKIVDDGIYYVTINNGYLTETKKIVLIK